jgi:phosphopantetheinyl transferase
VGGGAALLGGSACAHIGVGIEVISATRANRKMQLRMQSRNVADIRIEGSAFM